jgi:replicative superfamily II helicase
LSATFDDPTLRCASSSQRRRSRKASTRQPKAVIVAELDHPAGRGESTPYSVAEYKNIIGRAGRLGFSESGQSFLLVQGPVDEDRKWRHYVAGSPEDLRSVLLNPDVDEFTLVLRVLATATETARGTESSGMSIDDLTAFLSLSFGAHQAEREGRLRFEPDAIRSLLADLLRTGLVDEREGLLIVTELGRLAGSGVVTARTVLRIADFFGAVPAHELNRVSVICAAQVTEELEATQMPVNSRGWKKEQMTYGGVLQQQGAGVALSILFNAERRIAVQRAKRAVGCLLWMDGARRTDIDQAMTRHLPSRDGAAYARDAAARTRDVIDVVLTIAQLRHPTADLSHLSETLPVQLELGVPEEVVPIARVTGQRLTRGEYLRLRAAGLTDAAAIRAASDEELLSCVDGGRQRLQTLRDAADRAPDTQTVQDIVSLLAPPPAANNEPA